MVAEVIDGELHLNPRPGAPHASAASVLGMDLGGPFHRGRGGPGGWILLDEPELHLGDDIVSRRTQKTDRADKLPLHAREKVGHVWLLDPEQRTQEAFRRDGERWLLPGIRKDDAHVRIEPFDAIELELGGLWADIEK